MRYAVSTRISKKVEYKLAVIPALLGESLPMDDVNMGGQRSKSWREGSNGIIWHLTSAMSEAGSPTPRFYIGRGHIFMYLLDQTSLS